MMLCIAVCFLAVDAASGTAGENCTDCHRIALKGIHAALSCLSCHGDEVNTIGDPASAANRAAGCVGCHRGYGALFDHAMATRSRERLFVERTFAGIDPAFFQKNCNSCHLRGCTDCHGGDAKAAVPAGETWSGYPARPHREALRAQAAMFKLPSLIRALERLVAKPPDSER